MSIRSRLPAYWMWFKRKRPGGPLSPNVERALDRVFCIAIGCPNCFIFGCITATVASLIIRVDQ